MSQEHGGSGSAKAPSTRPSREIDENLRRVYQQTVEEDIPDRLKALVEKLRQQDERS